jgi:hypothetical protein
LSCKVSALLPRKNDKVWEDEIAHEMSIWDESSSYEMESTHDSGDVEGLNIEELLSLVAEGVQELVCEVR